MLPVSPKLLSFTPVMMFQGQAHEAGLLTHLKSIDGAQYDLVLTVNRKGEKHACLYLTLESRPPGQPLVLAIYGAKGRSLAVFKAGAQPTRANFLGAALFIANDFLQDTLVPAQPPAEAGRAIVSKTLAEFFPDARQRRSMHYSFAHVWLPEYAHSDPARFFGYFQRREQEPTRFVRSRWQMMEEDAGLYGGATMDKVDIRRVTDLTMTVGLPATPAVPGPAPAAHPEIFESPLPVAVVQMPPPEYTAHAWLVALVHDLQADAPTPAALRVFTLENSEGLTGYGILCEWQGRGKERIHRNHGTHVPITRDDFLKQVFLKMRAGED
jgi:hypothetical protein